MAVGAVDILFAVGMKALTKLGTSDVTLFVVS